ncbi:DUF1467 family protein [Zavarzinia compransoris]|uniref:DUF1467 domain-containing protein n=1 Tax=Zavarzinia compransoris TaxID=1264899 RepID=A0A317EA77_9PROT|nr:DUF1467 family protein [Zavarzinia compransoris]PWR23849.1 DUF1467 domain-containing protein [Zavarzinia compransoris]TDP48085.1 putative secreted protein [Zavarzinia compransoris]
MTIIGGIVFFSITWWLVFFAVLPWGVRSHEEDRVERVTGVPGGIPHTPRLGLKALITTGITLVLLAVFSVVVEYDLVGFRAFIEAN